MGFEKYTNYKDNAGVSSVVFGSEKPVLEVELNEVQEIQKHHLNRAMKRLFGNGITDKSKITYDGANLKVLTDCAFIVDGYLVECTGLSIPATSGTVYLQVWEETVSSTDTLKKEGNQQESTNVTNFIKDSRSPVETSKRKVVKYTLATSTNSGRSNLAIATISNGVHSVVCKEVSVAKLTDTVIDLREQTGVYGDGVVGIEVDLDNNSFKRVGDNELWTKETEYDTHPIYGGRTRCVVADDGVVVAKYGEEGYTETGALEVQVGDYVVGTKVQCMVLQPKFYYKRIPVRLKKQTNGTHIVKGFHLCKFIDLISETPRDGFKLHPAFKKGATEVDYYLIAENDGSLETSAGYIKDESASIGSSPYTGVKFSSIAGAKPASGQTNNLTRDAVRKICANRGTGFHQIDVTIESAEQMLFTIEYATMNMQNCSVFGAGITTMPWNNVNDSVPCPVNEDLGNGSGTIATSYTHSNGTTYQLKVPVYRGVKNPFGNIWKFVDGFLRDNRTETSYNEFLYQDGSKAFSDNADDYEHSGFSCAVTEGYIKYFGYTPECDWCYITSLTGGDANRPVGDYYYVNMGRNLYIALLGAYWYYGSYSGPFCWGLLSVASVRNCRIGGRLAKKG